MEYSIIQQKGDLRQLKKLYLGKRVKVKCLLTSSPTDSLLEFEGKNATIKKVDHFGRLLADFGNGEKIFLFPGIDKFDAVNTSMAARIIGLFF